MKNSVKHMKITGTMSLPAKKGLTGGTPNVGNWEIRPGGMVVQKRNPDSNQISVQVRTITVRVKYGLDYHQIHINSQASFGELKKMVSESTGLHSDDQKLFFKGKERESKAYLDVAGVKQGSKLVLIEDVSSRERRCLELIRSVKKEKASKAIKEISLEVDKLADQVSVLESKIAKGLGVVGKDLEDLTELLMLKLIKLDEIVIDGELKSQRKMQVRRVQKYIEILDKLKTQISNPEKNGGRNSTQPKPVKKMQPYGKISLPVQQYRDEQNQVSSTEEAKSFLQQPLRQQNGKLAAPVVVTTKWEIFD